MIWVMCDAPICDPLLMEFQEVVSLEDFKPISRTVPTQELPAPTTLASAAIHLPPPQLTEPPPEVSAQAVPGASNSLAQGPRKYISKKAQKHDWQAILKTLSSEPQQLASWAASILFWRHEAEELLPLVNGYDYGKAPSYSWKEVHGVLDRIGFSVYGDKLPPP